MTRSNSKTFDYVKLPAFEIKRFNGNPTNRKSFIESFDAAIHNNNQSQKNAPEKIC